MTLIELMVAITVLLVGVLGAVTLIDGANAQTSRTKAREGATALARSVVEIARGVPYRDLTSERVLAELDARDGFEDADPAPGHQVESRGFLYTVTPTVCSMDDPKDSLGEHDEVGVSFCANSDGPSAGGSVDRNPDDYRRVAVTLTWRAGGAPTDSVVQTGIVTNPAGGLGPSVLTLAPASPSEPEVLSSQVEVATYAVTTSSAAQDVAWSINGRRMGSATGSDREWTFAWDLGPANAPLALDCTYLVEAQAFDDKGRSGAPRALTVRVDRRRPFGPAGLAGGRNLRVDADDVDLQWDPNPECDVERYVVLRGVDGGPVDDPVCEVDAGEPTECVDESPPPGELVYEVVAHDAVGAGDRSPDRVTVPAGSVNQAPDPPASLSLCTGGAFEPPCLDIEGNPAPDGTAVLSWPPAADGDGDPIRFYRVYRDGTGYGDRLDVLFPVVDEQGQAVEPLVFVDATAHAEHQYWVTAVDERFGESDPVGPVGWAP